MTKAQYDIRRLIGKHYFFERMSYDPRDGLIYASFCNAQDADYLDFQRVPLPKATQRYIYEIRDLADDRVLETTESAVEAYDSACTDPHVYLTYIVTFEDHEDSGLCFEEKGRIPKSWMPKTE